MSVRYAPDPVRSARMSTEELRESFLVDSLFGADSISMVYSDRDRAVVGSAVPPSRTLALGSAAELRAETFCERRELGVLNIGGPGTVTRRGSGGEARAADAGTGSAARPRARPPR